MYCRRENLSSTARVLASVARLENNRHGYEQHLKLADYLDPRCPGTRLIDGCPTGTRMLNGYPGTRPE